MPKVQPNFDEAASPIEPGTYLCKIVNAELKYGKDKGTPYVNWKFETRPDPRTVYYSTPIEGRGAGMFKHFIKCIDPNYEGGEYDTDEALDQFVSAELDVEEAEYNGRNYLRFKVVNVEPATLEQLEKLRESEPADLDF